MDTSLEAKLPTHHSVPETEKTFAELGLSPEILGCLESVGFVHPTPIQAQAIPIALQGKDMIGCAQTGTGKTGAFVIPLAERLTHGQGVQGLILAPTREIALQIQAFIELFGSTHNLTAAVLIGGVRLNPQITELKKNPDIIVATPGRLFDHLERKNVSLKGVRELVFDEADRMLDMGFLPQIEDIMRHVPKDRHTMMFSATMASNVRRLAERYLKNPENVDISTPGATAEGIEHRLYLVDPMDRIRVLRALLQGVPGPTLVFVRMKSDVENVAKIIANQCKEQAAHMHADLTQKERIAALEAFRNNEVRILVATDVAARGLDVPQIAHVIHYGVPEHSEDYVHRSGRTARYFGTGVTSMIGTWMEKPAIMAIEKLIGKELPRCEMPGVPAFVELKVKPMGRSRPGFVRR